MHKQVALAFFLLGGILIGMSLLSLPTNGCTGAGCMTTTTTHQTTMTTSSGFQTTTTTATTPPTGTILFRLADQYGNFVTAPVIVDGVSVGIAGGQALGSGTLQISNNFALTVAVGQHSVSCASFGPFGGPSVSPTSVTVTQGGFAQVTCTYSNPYGPACVYYVIATKTCQSQPPGGGGHYLYSIVSWSDDFAGLGVSTGATLLLLGLGMFAAGVLTYSYGGKIEGEQ